MKQAGVTDPSKCYFVDDNRGNVDGAIAVGWGKCIHFCEKGLESVEGGIVKQIGDERLDPFKANGKIAEINKLEQLRDIWPDIFKKD
jgi:pyrimidine and pyridine-specific 5'-nucleotidase